MGGGHVKLRALGVLDREDLPARTVHDDLGGPYESPDAVVHMHHIFAGLQLVEIVDSGSRHRSRLAAHRAHLLLGEHAIGLGDDDQPRAVFAEMRLESGRQFVRLQHDVAARLRGAYVAFKPLPCGVEEFGMVGLVRAKLGEAGQGRRRKAVGRHTRRRRIARIYRAALHCAEVVLVVLQRQHERTLRQYVRERRADALAGRAFAYRQDGGGVDPRYRNLRGGVEGAQGLHLVAEEFRPCRKLLAWRPDVHNAAANGEFSLLRHGGSPSESDFGQFRA